MQATNLVMDYVSAWNQRDIPGIARLLTDNATYFDIPTHEKLTVGALVDHLHRAFEREPLRYDLVGDILVSENTIAFRYDTYDTSGDSGTRPVLSGAEFIVLSGDKFVRIDDYYSAHVESRTATDFAGGPVRTPVKYRKSGLSDDQMRCYLRRLTNAMEREKIYRRSDLSLPRLADHLDCSVNHLSQIINAEFGVGFFEFLNRYRIAEARRMLRADVRGDIVMMDIADRVGFKSQSSFYAAFRRLCQQTPAQFRRRCQRSRLHRPFTVAP